MLAVVSLSGGNDGLNTVIPFGQYLISLLLGCQSARFNIGYELISILDLMRPRAEGRCCCKGRLNADLVPLLGPPSLDDDGQAPVLSRGVNSYSVASAMNTGMTRLVFSWYS